MNRQSILDAASVLRNAAEGARIDDLPPELIPDSIEEAYAIQDALVQGEEIGGWKIAPTAAGQVPRCSIIAASRFAKDGSTLPSELRVPEVEVEVAFRLCRDLPGIAEPCTRQDVIDAIGSTHVAFEILDSRFLDRKKVSALTALADGQSNCLVIIGEGIRGYPASSSLRPSLTMGGARFEVEKALPENDALLGAVAWLAGHAATRGHPLRTGQIIITGARVGPFPIKPSTTLEAELAGIGRVRTELLTIEIA
jgi:2-keto-4-pentenoate hydratase